MSNLWSALEAICGQQAVLRWWRFYLREEFEIGRKYLAPTRDLALTIPSYDFYRTLEVRHLPSGKMIAFDKREQTKIELVRADVLLHRLDARRFIEALALALNCQLNYEPIVDSQSTWSVGTLAPTLESRCVYFAAPHSRDSLRSAASSIAVRLGKPFLLLIPTSKKLDQSTKMVLKLADCICIPANELFEIDAMGEMMAKSNLASRLQSAIGLTLHPPEPDFVFRLTGEYRTLKFAGKEISLPESVGLFFLSRILSAPNQTLTVAELDSARTGIHAGVLAGSIGKVFDEETKLAYKSRLDELDGQLFKLKKANDWGGVDQLTAERDEIIDQLMKATGLGGRTRENTDMDKARKRVSNAIAREIKRIQKHHSELGLYLQQTIKRGMTIRYEPPIPVPWEM